ncbi:hypothetical protein BDQ94DRAFT_116872 [Aspergillus welwitschiae]|uniref:Uncharacterized protein n=1 Tax=Aspergillus welwitschiae TaxID=1341132 RepID=A0A3F3QC18_9EURO|nr:hypothetical protein BDQ94DRAFT_116872 [Aspergillus welwitschiae]RDH36814.1 hypothetical protein BDQ94DRAFT_116872 [Aspergillus welwitschiae]
MGRSTRSRKQRRSLLPYKTESCSESGPGIASTRSDLVATPAAECSRVERKDSRQDLGQDLGQDESNLAAINGIMDELRQGEYRHFFSFLANVCAVARNMIDQGPPGLYQKAQEFTKEAPELLRYIMEGPNTTIIPLAAPILRKKDDWSGGAGEQRARDGGSSPSETSTIQPPSPFLRRSASPDVAPIPQHAADSQHADSSPATTAATEPTTGPGTPTVVSHQHPHNVASDLQRDPHNSPAGRPHNDGPENQQRPSDIPPDVQDPTALVASEISHAQHPSPGESSASMLSAGHGPSTEPCSQPSQGYAVLPQATTTTTTTPPPMSHATQPESSVLNGPVYGAPSTVVYNPLAQMYAGSLWGGPAFPSPSGQMLQSGQYPSLGHSTGLMNPLVPPHYMPPAHSGLWNQGLSAQTAQYPTQVGYLPNQAVPDGSMGSMAMASAGGYAAPSEPW